MFCVCNGFNVHVRICHEFCCFNECEHTTRMYRIKFHFSNLLGAAGDDCRNVLIQFQPICLLPHIYSLELLHLLSLSRQDPAKTLMTLRLLFSYFSSFIFFSSLTCSIHFCFVLIADCSGQMRMFCACDWNNDEGHALVNGLFYVNANSKFTQRYQFSYRNFDVNNAWELESL